MAKEPERPQTVNIAFWSIIAAGIAHLITQLIVLSLPNRGLSEQEIQLFEQEFGGLLEQAPFDDFATMLNSSMVTASMTVQAVIALVIYVLVALGIRHGWRSMRVIGTIFAVFSLLSFSFVSPLAAVFSVGSVILGIVGIVYAWLPASTEYFRRKAWQKAAKQAYPDMPLR
jgi:magnesium-transporting ATPase (P-type)